MSFVVDQEPPPHQPRHAAPDPWGDRIRTGVRGTGQTLITAGLVILLFVAYELWVTNIFNAHTQNVLQNRLQDEWSQGRDPLATGPSKPGTRIRDIPLGDGVALIRIPAFGPDWVFTVVEGTGESELAEGPGHYTDTALPGAVGDFAVAGHRVGKGSPFLNLDKLNAGDSIVIETKDYWYDYQVLGDKASGDATQVDQDGIPGLEIVRPTDIDVIDPVPGHPGRTPNRRLITLTTCHPRFSAAQRLIIHGEMVGAPLKKAPGVVPPALQNS
ncbi:MAG TPA: class E sortase [Mycobacteriales bacterium]|jgi:LPXTG-site transpeptidase (sortase) family protein